MNDMKIVQIRQATRGVKRYDIIIPYHVILFLLALIAIKELIP